MSEERPKNQGQLAFPTAQRGEAPGIVEGGTESLAVERGTESPAETERLMEEVVERMSSLTRSACPDWPPVLSFTRRTAVYGPVRTVVWEGRAGNRSPYPDRGWDRRAAESLQPNRLVRFEIASKCSDMDGAAARMKSQGFSA